MLFRAREPFVLMQPVRLDSGCGASVWEVYEAWLGRLPCEIICVGSSALLPGSRTDREGSSGVPDSYLSCPSLAACPQCDLPFVLMPCLLTAASRPGLVHDGRGLR